MHSFGQKHKLQYLDKICCVKSGFQIFYAVEQFSSLFWKDKLQHWADEPGKGETTVHGCHRPRDMAVRMDEVMAVCVCFVYMSDF